MNDSMKNKMRPAPVGYKWVIRYKEYDGQEGMGITNDLSGLESMITQLLSMGARDIVITDETFYKNQDENDALIHWIDESLKCFPVETNYTIGYCDALKNVKLFIAQPK